MPAHPGTAQACEHRTENSFLASTPPHTRRNQFNCHFFPAHGRWCDHKCPTSNQFSSVDKFLFIMKQCDGQGTTLSFITKFPKSDSGNRIRLRVCQHRLKTALCPRAPHIRTSTTPSSCQHSYTRENFTLRWWMEKQHKKGAHLVLLHLYRHLGYGNCDVCCPHVLDHAWCWDSVMD